MAVNRFEDLVAWQKARMLASAIYAETDAVTFQRDFSLKDQMRRSTVSIMANVAEGFERHRAGEFHQFLSVSKASCAELRSHLYVAQDVGFLPPETVAPLLLQAEGVGRVIGGLRSAVEGRAKRQSTQHSALSTQHSGGR